MKQRTPWPASLVAGHVVLVGCGSASDPDAASGGSKGRVVVRHWKSGDAAASVYIEKAETDFTRQYPGVTVEFVVRYYTLLGAAIRAGKGRDVMLFNAGQARDRADSLLPLDAYVRDAKKRPAGC